MKKIFLLVFLTGFALTVSAQKKQSHKKRAIAQTDYVSSRMNFNDEQKLFLFNALLEKYETISGQVKGKGLSKEERKAIFKQSNKAMYDKLNTKFSKGEVKKIKAYLKEFQEKNRKKR
ncbi:MAG: hypothetical protein DSY82_05105 [Flavobacteriia bacterium]|nr:MAG: hypothetical protein DSY82_05105 [Flavobacteriia bacterium]